MVLAGLSFLGSLSRRLRESYTRQPRRTFPILGTTLYLLSFAYFFYASAPWTWAAISTPTANSASLRILSWNIWLKNWDHETTASIIQSSDADVVALFEVNPEVGEKLAHLQASYPHGAWNQQWDPGSAVVLSRVPNTTFRTFNLGMVGMQAIEVHVPSHQGKPECTLLAIHTKSPTPFHPSRTRERDRQLADVVRWALETPGSKVVMGDLNITPFSPPFQRVLREGKLNDSRRGFGNQPSWPSVLGPLGIPIDHALVSDTLRVVHRTIIRPAPCSDHAPLLFEITSAAH